LRRYKAAISTGIQARQQQCANDDAVRQFSDDFVRAFDLIPRRAADCSTVRKHTRGRSSATVTLKRRCLLAGPLLPQGTPKVLFVRRVHYLAHPRHNGQIVRRLENEDEIFEALQAAAPAAGFEVLNGLFSAMSVGEQVAMVQAACVVAGAHGAGLSHVLFSPPGAHMLELRPPSFQRPHFIAYAKWAGALHHDWVLGTSTPAPAEVVARVQAVVEAAAGSSTARTKVLPRARVKRAKLPTALNRHEERAKWHPQPEGGVVAEPPPPEDAGQEGAQPAGLE